MNFDLPFYWRLFWRRLPVMTLFVLVSSSLGVITAIKLPETWSASARLLVEAPQIPDNMVRSTVQTDAIEQLDIIQQRLLTRANMIDIANRLNVFEDIRAMEPDRVLDAMRNATSIRRASGRNSATVLTIGFTGRTGAVAANVVNEYVTLVLDENTTSRMSRAENTLAFFNQEVRRLSEELDRQSAAIASFKTENATALPEDQSYRLGRQTLLQERLARAERDLNATQAQRTEILRIYERTGRIREQAQQLSPEEEQLNQLQAQIDLALLTYSETHPRVQQMRNRLDALIAKYEAQAAEQAAQQAASEEPGDAPATPENALLQATVSDLDKQINLLADDIITTQTELDRLQTAIARSSANGIRLNALERDYQNAQVRYNAALNNLNTAAMSERLETTAQGQRISVIENATAPQVPAGPNRPRIALMGAALGIAMAVGYFLLLEFLNRTVRRPAELVSRFNVVPIATIPFMESQRRRLFRRAGLIGATLAVLISVPIALWYVDQNFLPLEVIVQKGLNRLGLG
jgi:polysaccharide chain length determinant protein (PEP-CTERM system associated)